MGKYYELNDLEIEIHGIRFPCPEEDRQRYDELIEKIKKLKKEIAKECEEAIKHLTELINNCPNAYEILSITTGESELRSLFKLIVGRLRDLDPQNDLFKKI